MINTANTTRVPCNDPMSCSVAVAQLLYPVREDPWRANSVIVVNNDHFQTVIPIVSLIHFPFNAPILISNSPYISQPVLDEIVRLKPEGKGGVPQVILAGSFNEFTVRRLHQMGFSTLQFQHQDPIVQSIHIAHWRERLLPDMMPEMVTRNTFIVSVETPQEFLPILGFSAHMGTPILYVSRNSIPALTHQFLSKESERNISIIGSERTISGYVEEELRKLMKGKVERFEGDTLPDLTVRFTKSKSKQTDIGWGRDKSGRGDAHSFMPADWRYVMLSAPLSHLGKHTPLLPLTEGGLSKEYIDYLEYLRPRGMHPEPPFMHAFIIGGVHSIPISTQLQIEKHISFKETSEGMPPQQGVMEGGMQHG